MILYITLLVSSYLYSINTVSPNVRKSNAEIHNQQLLYTKLLVESHGYEFYGRILCHSNIVTTTHTLRVLTVITY